MASSASSYRRRQRQIAEVLVRYEMGHLLKLIGLERFVSLEHRVLRRGSPHTRPESLRRALEDLGPTFIKLGQVLSTRPDLLPADFQAELAKLQDDTTRLESQVIEEIISSELGAAPTEVFASFDPEPLAAASIGQVHAATLHDGTEVVVKVRRPAAATDVELDLEILKNLAARASHRWQEAEKYDLNGLAAGFANLLRAELDYLQEAGNAANFAGDPGVRIPSVYRELTTSRLITLERIRGIKISDLAALDSSGVDRAALAERLAATVVHVVLVDGLYHGDPQPGNLFVEPDGRLGIVDFGRAGRLDDHLRLQLSHLLIALVNNDADHLTSALLALRVSTAPVDRGRLRADLSALLSRYGGHRIDDVPIGAAVTAVLGIVRRHSLTMSPDVALLLAVLTMHESLTGGLDPDFRFEQALRPYVGRLLASSLTPRAIARRVEQFGAEFVELAGELPGQLHRLLETVGDGRFDVHLRTDELQPLVRRVERLADRLAIAILAAAAIDGLAELAAHTNPGQRPPRPTRAASVGVLAALAAYAVGRWSRAVKRSTSFADIVT